LLTQISTLDATLTWVCCAGKTYVGVQLVVALLANTQTGPFDNLHLVLDDLLGADKPAVGPLLVVCYTNHALDAFLEDLLDAGVPLVGDSGDTGDSKSDMGDPGL
jgi:hypothetical protein